MLVKLEFSQSIFEKNKKTYLNIRFNKNPSSGSQVLSCGDTDKPTDMTKLILAFRNFANVPNKLKIYIHFLSTLIFTWFKFQIIQIRFAINSLGVLVR